MEIIREYVIKQLNMEKTRINIIFIESIPRMLSGKVDYEFLIHMERKR